MRQFHHSPPPTIIGARPLPYIEREDNQPVVVGGLHHSVHWTFRENINTDQHNGLSDEWVVVHEFDNLVTSFGLTAFASAPSGQYVPPTFLVIDTSQALMQAASAGANSVTLATDPTVAGDTQLVLSVGLAAQETVTFTGKSGSAPNIVFSLASSLINAHATNDPVVRAPTASDTMTQVLSEAQYDPTFNPSNRLPMTAAFSPGAGQSTMQFFMSGLTATNLFFAHVGLADRVLIGDVTTSLHNYAALGYNHNNTNDLEIDVTYTLAVGSPSLSFLYYNVKDSGAVGNGVADDTTAIQAAITLANAAGGVVFFPAGTYKVTAPLNMASPNVTLLGVGGQGSIIQPSGAFVGSQIIFITADFCSVRDLTIAYASGPASGNPVANGININGAKSVTLFNVYLNFIDGWAVQSTGTAGSANYWCQMINVHTFQCQQGIHIIGASATSFNMAHTLTNCIVDQCQSSDGLFIEDAHDVVVVNLEGSVTAGSGNTLHIKGASAAIYVSNIDMGPAPGPSTSPTVLIESGSNGTPKQVTFNAGIVEGGSIGISITAGTQLRMVDLDLVNNGTHGISVSGAADAVVVEGCLFNLNGATAGASRYDFNSSTTGHVEVNDCYFLTPQGSLTQQTNNAINVTAGNVVCQNDTFSGTGYTTANIFLGFPKIIRACPGYNPLGSVTVTVPASTVDFATKSTDMMYRVSGGTVTIIKIGGVTTGDIAGWFRIPAQQVLNITYSVVPAVVAFSD